jgi:hypothetical protein
MQTAIRRRLDASAAADPHADKVRRRLPPLPSLDEMLSCVPCLGVAFARNDTHWGPIFSEFSSAPGPVSSTPHWETTTCGGWSEVYPREI